MREETCRCGSSIRHRKGVGPHIGLYCSGCGKWIKWITQKSTIEEQEVQELKEPSPYDGDMPWD